MTLWLSWQLNAAGPRFVATDLAQESVLDASVILALLRDERSDDDLLDLIEGAILSAVNLSEVLGKAASYGLTEAPLLEVLLGLLKRVEPFTASQAKIAADVWMAAPGSGLSFGDRACLALAIEPGAEVYTADQAWAELQVGCRVHFIR